jgi:hypothetical protein
MSRRSMRSIHSRMRSGRPVRRAVRVAFVVLLLSACSYGFEGGGFPAHIQTIYIAPFENETPQFDLDSRLFNALVEQLPGQLGLRTAGEESADAILRGRILRYDDVAQNYRPGTDQPGGNVISHEVQIGIAAELVDIRDNVIRWDARSLTGRGTYDPTAETDAVGQEEAIENLIEQIIDGAQSQW